MFFLQETWYRPIYFNFALIRLKLTGVIPKYEARHYKGILCNKSGVRSNKTL